MLDVELKIYTARGNTIEVYSFVIVTRLHPLVMVPCSVRLNNDARAD